MVAPGLPLALRRLQREVGRPRRLAGGGAAVILVVAAAAAVVGGGGAAAALLVVVALAGLVVLEPVEDVLALHLAEGAEVGGDALDLLRGGRPQPRAEELRQDLHLLRRRVPPPALHPYPPAQRLHDDLPTDQIDRCCSAAATYIYVYICTSYLLYIYIYLLSYDNPKWT